MNDNVGTSAARGADEGSVGHDPATLEAIQASPERPLLLRGGTVLSGDRTIGDLHGDVLVIDGRIAEVGPDLAARAPADALVVDARESFVMPGLIDSHLHAWEGQLRGLAALVDFETYTDLTHNGFAPHYTPDDMYVGNLLSAAVALDGGVTTILDNSHNSRSPEHSDAAVEGLVQSGIRAVHAMGAPQSGDSSHQGPHDILRLRDQYSAASDGRVTFRLMDTYPDQSLWRFAVDHGLWVSSEMGGYVGNLKEMADAGLLTPEHTFNHCFSMPDDDWRLIADHGVQVNMVPRSDAYFGLGDSTPPIDKALAVGIKPGLSMDNELSYGMDMFLEMQALIVAHRSRAFESAQATSEPAAHLTARQVLTFATVNGAANCGLSDVGTLRPGSRADVILVAKDHVNTAGVATAHAAVIGFASRHNVHTVLVDGRVRKWQGRSTSAGFTELVERAVASRERLMSARGLVPDEFSEHGFR